MKGRRTTVAVVTPNPTPYRAPFFRRLAQFDDLDLRVFFLTKGSPTRPWTVDCSGFEHEFLSEWSIPVGGKDRARYRVNTSIFRRLAETNPDACVVAGYNHFTTQAAIVNSIATRTPWCLMSESHINKKRGRLRVFLKRALLGPILRTMGAAMVTGTLARRYMESMGVAPDRIFIVANTPDVTALRKAAERNRPQRQQLQGRLGVGGKRVILFVGRLLEEKGLRTLFEAYETARSRRSDLALVIVGDGPRRRDYEALAEHRGLWDVRFAGFRPQDELPEIYAAADLFVLPSLVEPWGVVVNEAMASGLPVVLSDQVGASADLVEQGGNGFVVPVGNSAALAEKILDAFSNDARRREMGTRSLEIISGWDYEASAANFRAAIDKARAGKERAL